MKIHQKIRQVRKSLGLTLEDVHNQQVQDFGKNEAISYRTLLRIEQGQIARFSNITKICQTLGLSLPELLKNTDLEDLMLIRKNHRIDSHIYNKKVVASVLTSPSCSFLTTEVIFQVGGKTVPEQLPQDGKRYEKNIYIEEGSLLCMIGNEKFALKRKDSLTFNSTKSHYFENKGKKKCVCIITQVPKYF